MLLNNPHQINVKAYSYIVDIRFVNKSQELIAQSAGAVEYTDCFSVEG